jgi:hypothetical protein
VKLKGRRRNAAAARSLSPPGCDDQLARSEKGKTMQNDKTEPCVDSCSPPTGALHGVDAKEQPTPSRCKKLHELPLLVTDWQQQAWRPDCDYYDCGVCANPLRRDSNTACPFDGQVLPLREVAVEAPNDRPRRPLDAGFCEVPEGQPRSGALEHAIKDRIVNRTGGRVRALAIERTDRGLVVRGSAPCYYVKQLALQGVLDVLHSDPQTNIGCSLQIVVCPAGPTEPTALSADLL